MSEKKTSKEIILITGGARCGKSRMALRLAPAHPAKFFLATAEPLDEEMRQRIRRHRLERGREWTTIEEPVSIANVLQDRSGETAVIDCITLWISNLLMRSLDPKEIEARIHALTETLLSRDNTTIIVTNEVGMGIVPAHPSARLFRDLTGHANQRLADIADRVILMVSGLPLFLKGGAVANS
jgi:adenosyl cobinamide kinase/adenosyl cobinamide phosphate guanylyltransferase